MVQRRTHRGLGIVKQQEIGQEGAGVRDGHAWSAEAGEQLAQLGGRAGVSVDSHESIVPVAEQVFDGS